MASAKTKPAVEYFFCPNVDCNAHVTLEPGTPPPDSGFVEGSDCPLCVTQGRNPPGQVRKILLDPVGKAKRGVQTAIALPGSVYGGLILQRGDDDSKSQWGGVVVSDPKHDQAQYVAELQVDLLRLGYYGPARGGETRGLFGLQLMANVLNLKQHLTKFYGVASFDPLDPKATSTQAPAGSIIFPPQGLVGPTEILGGSNEWAKVLGENSTTIPLGANLKKYGEEWEKLQRRGAPSLDELPALREGTKADAAKLKEVRASTKKADTAAVAFGRKHNVLNKNSLTEDKVAEAEDALNDLISACAEGGDVLPELADKQRALNARLPSPANAQDPGNDDVTLVVADAADGSLEARFDRVKAAAKAEQKVRDKQRRLANFTNALSNSFPQRLDALGKKWSDHLKLEGLLFSMLEKLKDDIVDAADGAAKMNAAAPAPKDKQVPQPVARTRQRVAAWLDNPEAKPPQVGSIRKSITQMEDFEKKWVATDSTPAVSEPARWTEIKGFIEEIEPTVARLRDEVTSEKAATWSDTYKQMLRTYGQVDVSFARFVRSMSLLGELNGKKVFLTPMNSEIRGLSKPLKDELPGILDDALKSVGRAAGDGPLPIVDFIYNHESGGNHTRKFAGVEFVTLGIDWPNRKTGNASFDEDVTPAQKLSTSRGWGATQFTLFEGDKDLVNESGQNESFSLHAGVPFTKGNTRPLPLAIVSARENLRAGTSLYLGGFGGPRRECSFEESGSPSSGSSFKCKDCAKRLETGPSQNKPGGIKAFDDAKGDFEQLHSQKSLYRIRTLERVRELVGSGFFSVPDGRTGDQLREADQEEFPCSWLAGIIRYAGVSRRGFDYMLEAVDTLKK